MTYAHELAQQRHEYVDTGRAVCIEEVSANVLAALGCDGGCAVPRPGQGYPRFYVFIDEAESEERKTVRLYHELGHVDYFRDDLNMLRRFMGWSGASLDQAQQDAYLATGELRAFRASLTNCRDLAVAGWSEPLRENVQGIWKRHVQGEDPPYDKAIAAIMGEAIWTECQACVL